MPNSEPVPYRPNQYREKLGMIGDVSAVLFERYAKLSVSRGDFKGQPIEVVDWVDPDLHTSYKLARFAATADVPVIKLEKEDVDIKDGIELYINEELAFGEVSKKVHYFIPRNGTYNTHHLQRTREQQKEFEERLAEAVEIPTSGSEKPLRILPPVPSALDPEYDLELYLQILDKAFDILETTHEAE